MKPLRASLLSLCFIFLLSPLQAQLCPNATVDQQQNGIQNSTGLYSRNLLGNILDNTLAQSFIPQAGNIGGVQVELRINPLTGPTVDLTGQLWDALPTQTGANLLASGVATNAGPGPVTISWTPVNVTTGTTYYLVFRAVATTPPVGQYSSSLTNTNNFIVGSDPYPNGEAFGQPNSTGPFNPFVNVMQDFTFKTFSCGPSTPVPTLGTWGLLLLALLVLNLGAIALIRQRKALADAG